MVNLSGAELAEIQAHLQNAVISCSERCLWQSAKWAAELLNSIDEPADASPEQVVKSTQTDPREAQLEAKELPRYLLAKSFFDCREYDRCAGVFLPYTLPRGVPSARKGTKKDAAFTEKSKLDSVIHETSQKSLFLALYAKYMAGEKRRDEESEMILGPNDGPVTTNKELAGVSRVLEAYFDAKHAKGQEGMGWLEYLYGIVLMKGKSDEEAKKWFIRSVHLYSYNWGAWLELASLIPTADELDAVTNKLPRNIMTYIFYVHTSQELTQTDEGTHNQLSQVLQIFPKSSFLKTQRALMYYHSKDFDESQSIFSDILREDPYRLDFLDSYSNVLYVMEDRTRLSFVAQIATQVDKFRPETCCVVGNFYSLRSEHEKAVMYFRRALTLDRNFLSAWTLMGHEYVEMKNTHAAIESYRRAVDVNRKDFRAWYGLGQTYEVLEMHQYALYYHQRAAALRPYDPKMWQAVGACFAKTGKYGNGIRAYKRALIAGSDSLDDGRFSPGEAEGSIGGIMDPDVLYQIALLYEQLGDQDECAAYMELTLAQEEGPGYPDDVRSSLSQMQSYNPKYLERYHGTGVTPTTSKARMWLAKWEFVKGGYQRSMELANELCQDGVEVEDAKALVRDIRARIEHEKDERERSEMAQHKEWAEMRFTREQEGRAEGSRR